MSALSASATADAGEARPDEEERSGDPTLSPSDGVFTSAPWAGRRDEVADAGSEGSSGGTAARELDDLNSSSQEDFGNTSEVAAFQDELLESTAARPQRPSEVSTASALDTTGLNPRGGIGDPDEDVVVADDLADLIETDEEDLAASADGERTDQGEKPKRKVSSVPPPLPRS